MTKPSNGRAGAAACAALLGLVALAASGCADAPGPSSVKLKPNPYKSMLEDHNKQAANGKGAPAKGAPGSETPATGAGPKPP